MKRAQKAVWIVTSWTFSVCASAQVEPPAVEWERAIEDEGFETARIRLNFNGEGVLQLTRDGGYIFAGYTVPDGSWDNTSGLDVMDAYLVKTDGAGNKLWSKIYERPCPQTVHSVCQTTDGGYIAAGNATGVEGDCCPPDDSMQPCGWDLLLLRTDSRGELKWLRRYNVRNGYDKGRSVRQTRDGGFIVAGVASIPGPREQFYNRLYLLKTDAEGDVVWSRTYGTADGRHEGYAVRECQDGGFIAVGQGYRTVWDDPATELLEHADRDAYVVKTDAWGVEEWSRYFGTENDRIQDGPFLSVDLTRDGGYVMIANEGFVELGRRRLIKLDAEGNEMWSKAVSLSPGGSVRQTPDGGYVIAGRTFRAGEGQRATVCKCDERGDELWRLVLDRDEYHHAQTVEPTSDGGYIVAIYPNSIQDRGFYLVKLAPDASPVTFERGDSNGDGDMDLNDAVFTLNHLFLGGPNPDCADAADTDDSGILEISDPIYTLIHIFFQGSPPPAPGDSCGPDPTIDDLTCGAYAACEEP
jgi:hypothetical protein